VLSVGSVRAAQAQGGAAAPAPARRSGELWFDPTQLPSFTGTVERYLLNPGGETDALLFREGPQIVFPPEVADAIMQAAPPGRPLIVWGIRARNAPVITMLAFAANAESTPRLIERPYWRLGGRDGQDRMQRLSVAGTVRQPYWSPQGEVAGAVLEDGTVVLLPASAMPASDGLREAMKQGAKLAAEGIGVAPPAEGQGGAHSGASAARALIADRVGETPGALHPLPAPAAIRR
jgi:hypothetical protein